MLVNDACVLNAQGTYAARH